MRRQQSARKCEKVEENLEADSFMSGLVFSGISEKEDLILWFCFALVWFQTEHKEDSEEIIVSLKHSKKKKIEDRRESKT